LVSIADHQVFPREEPTVAKLTRLTGTVLYGVGLLGLVAVTAWMVSRVIGAEPAPAAAALPPREQLVAAPQGTAEPVAETPTEDEIQPADEAEAAVDDDPGPHPITGLRIASINLKTEVVVAEYSEQDGGTWLVPKFKAGHAELTAGAGEVGNAVLFGHVTSLTLGNVFERLHRVHVGDTIEVYSNDRLYDYQVTELRTVSRTDVSVLDPQDTPSISLITCTGAWLPLLNDYAQRLVVRGELVNRSA